MTRRLKTFTCHRCRASIPDYLAFGVGGNGGPSKRHYCLHHIPRWVRIRMWLRERINHD